MSLHEDSSADLKARLAELGLQVTIGKKSIEATMKLTSIAGIGAKEIGQKTVAKIEIPTTSSWNGHEDRLRLVPPTNDGKTPNEALVDLIARTFAARDTLLAMDDANVREMPIRHRRHLERTARLSYLAPDIVLAILDGKQPSHLSARKLVRAASLPLDWSAQRQMLLAR